MDVLAELDANVWKVLVNEGDSVAEGDVLIILESMKMEINVEAPVAGTITGIDVSEEDAVEQDQRLVVISTS